jgi:RNA recognition motif-containing protein
MFNNQADKGPFTSNTQSQSKREPIKRNTEPIKAAANRLYVGNLTNDIVEADLEEAFSPFGEIVRCQVQCAVFSV